MFDYLLRLYRKLSGQATVADVVSSFQSTVDALEAISERETADAQDARAEAESLLVFANYAEAQSRRAQNVANKVKALLS